MASDPYAFGRPAGGRTDQPMYARGRGLRTWPRRTFEEIYQPPVQRWGHLMEHGPPPAMVPTAEGSAEAGPVLLDPQGRPSPGTAQRLPVIPDEEDERRRAQLLFLLGGT
jgi:hypothetical protein